jgi:hypothetical protein
MPRYAQLLVSDDLIGSWLLQGTPHAVIVANHLPDDARLAGAYTAHPGIIGLIFESAAFPEAGPGSDAAMLPLLPSPVLKLGSPPPGSILPSAN